MVVVLAGASVNAQTFTKGTALTYACENGHTEVAEVLIHRGAELVSCSIMTSVSFLIIFPALKLLLQACNQQ